MTNIGGVPKLIFNDSNAPVQIGDVVRLEDGLYKIVFFRPPHKSNSEGKVTIRGKDEPEGFGHEVYVSVIGAKWINRTDRGPEPVAVVTICAHCGKEKPCGCADCIKSVAANTIDKNIDLSMGDPSDRQQIIMDQVMKGHLDVTAPEHVEVKFDQKTNVLWVNINGICALRACRIGKCEINLENRV